MQTIQRGQPPPTTRSTVVPLSHHHYSSCPCARRKVPFPALVMPSIERLRCVLAQSYAILKPAVPVRCRVPVYLTQVPTVFPLLPSPAFELLCTLLICHDVLPVSIPVTYGAKLAYSGSAIGRCLVASPMPHFRPLRASLIVKL